MKNYPHFQRILNLIQELVLESNITPSDEEYYYQAEIASNDSGELTIGFLRSRIEGERQLPSVSPRQRSVLRARDPGTVLYRSSGEGADSETIEFVPHAHHGSLVEDDEVEIFRLHILV